MNLKVGVFDSGVGGITVLTALRRQFPSLDYFYLGDTAHLPYGTKSPAQIQRLSSDCALLLRDQAVDILVVACNTSSSWALPDIVKVMGSVPVMGVVEPGVDAALGALERMTLDTLDANDTNDTNDTPDLGRAQLPILVLATQATIKSQAYLRSLNQRLEALQKQSIGHAYKATVIEQACPLLVPMIEEGWIDHEILHRTVQEYVGRHYERYPPGVALLGCTHYPWIHRAFQRALPGWIVVNSATAVVRAFEANPVFENFRNGVEIINRPGKLQWLYTDPEAVPQFVRQIVQESTENGLEKIQYG
jgi:glutamate racemase